MSYTRRKLLAGFGLASLHMWVTSGLRKAEAFSPREPSAAEKAACPFRLAVINNEITQDFERACQLVPRHFGFRCIELRARRNKIITDLRARPSSHNAKLPADYKPPVNNASIL